MFELEKARLLMGSEQFEHMTTELFDLCEEALLENGPEIEAQPAEKHCEDYEEEDAEEFLGMYSYVVELGTLAAVLVHRLEQRVDLGEWHPLERLSLVATWITREGQISEYGFDYHYDEQMLERGLKKYRELTGRSPSLSPEAN